MNPDGPDQLRELERFIGYRFRDDRLLTQALTHRSYVNENSEEGLCDNERLEFLGDAVLNLVISHRAMVQNPDFSEGELSKLRSAMVNESALARMAKELSIGAFILLGRGEDSTNGREKHSILSDTYEAIVAAVYLDGGIDEASAVIESHFDDQFENLEESQVNQDYKTRVQERVQGTFRITPDYVLAGEWGPDHNKTFHVRLLIHDELYGEGEGKSKKEAEQKAARQALDRLDQEGGGEGEAEPDR